MFVPGLVLKGKNLGICEIFTEYPMNSYLNLALTDINLGLRTLWIVYVEKKTNLDLI